MSSSSSSSGGKTHSAPYRGNLQDRLRNLAIRTSCPTRQENGQRYLGPPIHWTAKPPQNSEVFISKLPADCFEDEIYDFCSQAGEIYLIRLMINFENENRGFCFVTFAGPKQAADAVALLPQRPLRKNHFIHAEISLNNCSLKMYGLDYRFDDATLENEIRMNTKDVVNVAIKRNTTQQTLMATLYFETHQKAAIARRKLSQIANSRWGQNVKVFLWSKKLQNKQQVNNKDNCTDVKNKENKFTNNSAENLPIRRTLADLDVNSFENEFENTEVTLKRENQMKSNYYNIWMQSSMGSNTYNVGPPDENFSINQQNGYVPENANGYSSQGSSDFNNNFSPIGTFNNYSYFPNLSPTLRSDQFSPPSNYFVKPLDNEHSSLSSSMNDETMPNFLNLSFLDSDPLHTCGMNLKSDYHGLLDLSSPIDFLPQNDEQGEHSLFSYSPNQQIELILNEASEALCSFSLNNLS